MTGRPVRPVIASDDVEGRMAARQDIRDRTGRLLGWRQENGNRIDGRDAGGMLRGWYDPRQNETKDACGRLVGKSDILAALIVAP